MTKTFKKLNHKIVLVQGFTLVEMAIVLIIFGLLLAMFLSPLTTQRDIQNRAKTQILLNEAKEALMGYALTNGYLPCPDTKDVPDGIQSRNGNNCVHEEGVLPWNDLGIERVDAWNHYFRYRVDSTFSDSVTKFTITHAENASGIQILGENKVAIVSTKSRPAVVVLSHGTNGFGAINLNSTSPANKEPKPTDTATDELENSDDDVTFVSHVPTPQGSANEFDDMMVWISPKVLISKMISAERLP